MQVWRAMVWNRTWDEAGEPRIYIVRRFLGPHHNDEVNAGLSSWKSLAGSSVGARNGSLGTAGVSSPGVCVNLGQATLTCASYLHKEEGQVLWLATTLGLINGTPVAKHVGQVTQPPKRMH